MIGLLLNSTYSNAYIVFCRIVEQ